MEPCDGGNYRISEREAVKGLDTSGKKKHLLVGVDPTDRPRFDKTHELSRLILTLLLDRDVVQLHQAYRAGPNVGFPAGSSFQQLLDFLEPFFPVG